MEAMIHLRSFKENTQDEREPGPGQSSASAVSVGQWGESRFQWDERTDGGNETVSVAISFKKYDDKERTE
jgi:hypothetical protein